MIGRSVILNNIMVKNIHNSNPLNKEFIVPKDRYIIGADAFCWFKEVESVVMHDYVEEIGIGAFSGCKKIKNIPIPKGLLYIKQCAFSGCESLEKIEIPQQVEIIEPWTFGNCPKLKEVVLPKKLHSFAYSVFENSDNIENITFTDGENHSADNRFYTQDGCLYDRMRKKLLKCFSHNSEITVADGTEIIDEQAFANRNKMKKVNLPRSLKTIVNSFKGCDSLSEICFPDGNDVFEAKDGFLYEKKNNALHRVYSLDKVIAVPKFIKDIRNFVFPKTIEEIVLPDSLEKINLKASENPNLERFVKIKHNLVNMRKMKGFKICKTNFSIEHTSAKEADLCFYINKTPLFEKKIVFTKIIAQNMVDVLQEILSSNEGSFSLSLPLCDGTEVTIALANSGELFKTARAPLTEEILGRYLSAVEVLKVVRMVDRMEFVQNFYQTIITLQNEVKSGLIETILENGNLEAIYERM
ncbi:MAG: leucine-rich repeat protein [Spirochaetaceae bacterium]|nr:leucine-rich repeat protein [Spirochaetaceae bacterium]